jgi:hypothetical protein
LSFGLRDAKGLGVTDEFEVEAASPEGAISLYLNNV